MIPTLHLFKFAVIMTTALTIIKAINNGNKPIIVTAKARVIIRLRTSHRKAPPTSTSAYAGGATRCILNLDSDCRKTRNVFANQVNFTGDPNLESKV